MKVISNKFQWGCIYKIDKFLLKPRSPLSNNFKDNNNFLKNGKIWIFAQLINKAKKLFEN